MRCFRRKQAAGCHWAPNDTGLVEIMNREMMNHLQQIRGQQVEAEKKHGAVGLRDFTTYIYLKGGFRESTKYNW